MFNCELFDLRIQIEVFSYFGGVYEACYDIFPLKFFYF